MAFRHLAIAALGLMAHTASAVPGPPLSCGGTFGVGGCAPYASYSFHAGLFSESGYEYASVPLGVNRQSGFSAMAATVNLTAGTVSATSDADFGADRTTSIASAADVFVFQGSGGMTGSVLVDFVVRGTSRALFASRGPSGSANVSIGSPSLAPLPGSGSGGVTLQGGFSAPIGVLVESSFASTLRAMVPLAVPLQIDYGARTDAHQGAEFVVEGQLAIFAPPGVTYSSFEGFTSPVPEPAGYLLTALGLMLVGAAARRRNVRGPIR